MATYRAYHVDEHGHFRGVPQIYSAETDEVVEMREEGGRLVAKLKRRH